MYYQVYTALGATNMIPGSQIRARMQRGGHGCSVEGAWVRRTREPASPDVDLVWTETKKIKSRSELIFVVSVGRDWLAPYCARPMCPRRCIRALICDPGIIFAAPRAV